MPYFLMKLIPPRPTFPADASPEELTAMSAHGAFIRDLIKNGSAHAAGPVMDPSGTWGFALAEAGDIDAARAMFDRDPVILADLGFDWQAFPMGSLLLPER